MEKNLEMYLKLKQVVNYSLLMVIILIIFIYIVAGEQFKLFVIIGALPFLIVGLFVLKKGYSLSNRKGYVIRGNKAYFHGKSVILIYLVVFFYALFWVN